MSLNRVLSVMIPAFELMLSHVLEQPEVGGVIAVDDGSNDGTWEIMSRVAQRDRRVRALRLETNKGKGAALRRAIAEVRMPLLSSRTRTSSITLATIRSCSGRWSRRARTWCTASADLPARPLSASGSSSATRP